MKNYADLGGCYPPKPKASADNTLLDLHNSSYHTQPHPIIANHSQSRHLGFGKSGRGGSAQRSPPPPLVKISFSPQTSSALRIQDVGHPVREEKLQEHSVANRASSTQCRFCLYLCLFYEPIACLKLNAWNFLSNYGLVVL